MGKITQQNVYHTFEGKKQSILRSLTTKFCLILSICFYFQIAKIVFDTWLKARKGKLMPNDVTGGTFTITNLGALGGGYRFETVIINQPESAILGTGGITDRAVVREGQVVIRPIMTYYLTYDHRVFNGAEASKFVMKIAHLLENPGLLML